MKLLKGAWVYRAGGFEKADVLIEGARFSRIGTDLSIPQGAETIDLRGYCLIPGFADVHVHFREPGFFYKETIASGSRAAARGGYTCVCTMPNLNPAPDSLANLQPQLNAIQLRARVHVIPYGTMTRNQMGKGECADYRELMPYVAGFSDDGRGVQEEETMRRCMLEIAEVNGIAAAHCEVNGLLGGGYIHDGDYARANGHPGIPSASEYQMVERDLRLAKETGCRYHVCHVSCKESVAMIRRAKDQGVDVTCETAPHYLALNDWDISDDGRFKMNPPIRSMDDQQALLDGIRDGTIDMIATDHAPHTLAEKSKGLKGSLMGVVGLETAFPVLYTKLVKTGIIPMEKLMDLMIDAPRRRFPLPGGSIEAGAAADFAVLDTQTEYTIDPSDFATQGRSTPFEGWKVSGRTVMTVIGGETVYQQKEEK